MFSFVTNNYKEVHFCLVTIPIASSILAEWHILWSNWEKSEYTQNVFLEQELYLEKWYK